jgi:hypothetical protein
MPVYRKLAVATEVYGFKPLNWFEVPGQVERYSRIDTYWDATLKYPDGHEEHYREEAWASMGSTGKITGQRTGFIPSGIGTKYPVSTDSAYRKTSASIVGTLINTNTREDVGTYGYALSGIMGYESAYAAVAGACASISFDEVEWPEPSVNGGTRNKLFVIYNGSVYEHTGFSLGTSSLASAGLGLRLESLESYFYFLRDRFPELEYKFGAWRRELITRQQAEADAYEIVFVKGQGRLSDSRVCKYHLLFDQSVYSCEKNLGPAVGVNTITAEPLSEFELRGNYARVYWNKLFPTYASYPPCCGA